MFHHARVCREQSVHLYLARMASAQACEEGEECAKKVAKKSAAMKTQLVIAVGFTHAGDKEEGGSKAQARARVRQEGQEARCKEDAQGQGAEDSIAQVMFTFAHQSVGLPARQ